MSIAKQEKKNGVDIIYLKKVISDQQLEKIVNKPLRRDQIKLIIKDDADVYDEDGKMLLRFRKNKLKRDHIDEFYDNVIDFAKRPTNNRGTGSGSKSKNFKDNPDIMTNILGYFDRLSPSQKANMKKYGVKTLGLQVRETYFNAHYPEKFKKCVPLIQEIDRNYAKYAPDQYKTQRRKANQTPFHIQNTAFTTITVNVNFKTTVHTDKGDDPEGFGNLVVIERGEYEGSETCFPQYGCGVDVRTGDILFMNVHQLHGNLPMVKKSKDAIRLAIVSYLRNNIWKNTKGFTRKQMQDHIQQMHTVTRKSEAAKKANNKTQRQRR